MPPIYILIWQEIDKKEHPHSLKSHVTKNPNKQNKWSFLELSAILDAIIYPAGNISAPFGSSVHLPRDVRHSLSSRGLSIILTSCWFLQQMLHFALGRRNLERQVIQIDFLMDICCGEDGVLKMLLMKAKNISALIF